MDDAIRTTLTDVVAFLTREAVPFALIGGVAVTVRGEPRFTADIDLLAGVDIDRGLELVSVLDRSAFSPLFPDAAEVVRASFILPLRHRQTMVKVDLAIGLTGFERRVIQRAERTDFGELIVPVATAEDLILMKVLAGRPRDVEDAGGIVVKHGERLDWAYVLETGRELEEAVGQGMLVELQKLQRRSREER